MRLGHRLRRCALTALALCFVTVCDAGAVSIDPASRTVTAAHVRMAFSTNEPDLVSSLQWMPNGPTSARQLVNNTGTSNCGMPAEPARYWGESFGDGNKSTPELVFEGSFGTWGSPAANQVQSTSEYPTSCSGLTNAVPVSTTYTFYDQPTQADQIAVRRTWRFDLVSPPTGAATGFRAYAPTLPVKEFAEVLYPAGNSLQTWNMEATPCENPCLQELQRGWFAINDGTVGGAFSGSGMIVLRDPADIAGARLAIQEAFEQTTIPVPVANISAVDLPIPTGGLKSAISETEYLCFYDAASWPQSQREALILPSGCGPPPSGGSTVTQTIGQQNSTGTPSTATGPPTPVPFRSVALAPAGGTVLVQIPGSHTYSTLSSIKQIPTGALVDARHGTVRLLAARDSHGHTQSGLFTGGIFLVTQIDARSPLHHSQRVILTVLALAGPLPSNCRAHRLAHQARSSGRRRLWGNAKGNFRTVGHYASATVRGTHWLTEDSCAGTRVHVARGVVSVIDFPHHRSQLVRARHSLLAHPGRGG